MKYEYATPASFYPIFEKLLLESSKVSEKNDFLVQITTVLKAKTITGRKFRETEKPQNLSNSIFAKFSFRRKFMINTFVNNKSRGNFEYEELPY